MKPSLTARWPRLAGLGWLALAGALASAQTVAAAQVSEEIESLRSEFRQELAAVRQENAELRNELTEYRTTRAEQSRRIDEIELQIDEAEGLTSGYDKGFYIKSPDDKFKLKFGGYIQFQGNVYENDNIPDRAQPVFNDGLNGVNRDNTFFLRRVRLKASGHIYNPKLTFAIQADFAASAPILRDGFIAYAWNDHFQVKMGQFKAPFSIENMTSSSDLETIERSAIVDLLGLDRRIGVQVEGEFLEGKLGYAVMLANNLGFGSEGRNSSASNDSFAYIGRILAQPWKDSGNKWVKDLQVSLAGATGLNGPPSGSSGMTVSDMISTPGQNPRVSMTVPYIGGHQNQVDAGISWFVDRWHLVGEYIWANVDRRDIPQTDVYPFGAVNLNPAKINGGYLQLSYILTDRPGMTLVPVIKYEVMHVKDDERIETVLINPTTMEMGRVALGDYNNDVRAFTAGITWFINPNFKIMGNWVYESVGDDLIGSTRLRQGENRDQNIFMIRSQVKF
ncbi:MAG: porin [Deltaproteobacteria bacterium]|nr:porin [Deltaproteobacteria bacterium]